MPATFPSPGFDVANWQTLGGALNASMEFAPDIGMDMGGHPYIGRMVNGWGCVAVSQDQFATATHAYPGTPDNPGTVDFHGISYRAVSRINQGEFGLMKVAAKLPVWCRINFSRIGPLVPCIVWGYGKGYKPQDAPYIGVHGTYTFPTWGEARALRWGKIRTYPTQRDSNVVATFSRMEDPDGNAAVTGGDSGCGLFLLNPGTLKHELIGLTWHAEEESIQTHNPFSGQYSDHASSFAAAAWLAANLTPSTPGEVPAPVTFRLTPLAFAA